jgi:hypothetical protein
VGVSGVFVEKQPVLVIGNFSYEIKVEKIKSVESVEFSHQTIPGKELYKLNVKEALNDWATIGHIDLSYHPDGYFKDIDINIDDQRDEIVADYIGAALGGIKFAVGVASQAAVGFVTPESSRNTINLGQLSVLKEEQGVESWNTYKERVWNELKGKLRETNKDKVTNGFRRAYLSQAEVYQVEEELNELRALYLADISNKELAKKYTVLKARRDLVVLNQVKARFSETRREKGFKKSQIETKDLASGVKIKIPNNGNEIEIATFGLTATTVPTDRASISNSTLSAKGLLYQFPLRTSLVLVVNDDLMTTFTSAPISIRDGGPIIALPLVVDSGNDYGVKISIDDTGELSKHTLTKMSSRAKTISSAVNSAFSEVGDNTETFVKLIEYIQDQNNKSRDDVKRVADQLRNDIDQVTELRLEIERLQKIVEGGSSSGP